MTYCPVCGIGRDPKCAWHGDKAMQQERRQMTTHIMLDIETWGKTPGSDIRSIGACVFAPVARHGGSLVHDGSLGTIRPFYVATENPIFIWEYDDGCLESRTYQLSRDPETVKWWNDQSPEAQAAFANPVDLREACLQFGDWLYKNTWSIMGYPGDHMLGVECKLWCNGPHFDEAILAAVYRAVGLPVPWHYRAPRDFRTITDAAGMTRDDFKPFSHGTAHNALDDAISQAKIVCEAYRRLGLQRV